MAGIRTQSGGTRYSPLTQIKTGNVTQLRRAWTYHAGESGRSFETTPLMVDNVLYFSTQNQNVIALEPEAGQEIWKYNAGSNSRENRGVAYWLGDRTTPARILFGAGDGRLIALDAKTGKPADGFGDKSVVNLRTGVTDKFPGAAAARSGFSATMTPERARVKGIPKHGKSTSRDVCNPHHLNHFGIYDRHSIE